MKKIKASSVMNAAKISLGCAAAIVISDLLGLRYSSTAGLIAVLSIQNTKRETLEIAVKRLVSFFGAVVISYVCFHFMGFTTSAFAVYLFIFIVLCGLFGTQSAIVPVSVLVTHILAEKEFTMNVFINEFLLLFIGAGTGFLLNLYLHRDMKKMAEYKSEVDNEIKAIIGRMSDRILVSDKSDYNSDCFKRLKGYLESAKATALENHQNTLLWNDDYDMLYLEMREKQIVILYEMYKAVKEMDATPEQADVISQLLKMISSEYHENNNVDMLISETNRVMLAMRSENMPQTRSEFENRAVLFTLLIRIREFLSIKNLFIKSRK